MPHPTPEGAPRPRTSRAARFAAVLALIAGVAVVGPIAAPAGAAPAPAAPQTPTEHAERQFADLINGYRWLSGLPTIPFSPGLGAQSRGWSGHMAATGRLAHHPNVAAEVAQLNPGWRSYGENVGVGHDVRAIFDAFMASEGHRAKILGDYHTFGVGVVQSGGRNWVTIRFLK